MLRQLATLNGSICGFFAVLSLFSNGSRPPSFGAAVTAAGFAIAAALCGSVWAFTTRPAPLSPVERLALMAAIYGRAAR